jgi:hypothetical protein
MPFKRPLSDKFPIQQKPGYIINATFARHFINLIDELAISTQGWRNTCLPAGKFIWLFNATFKNKLYTHEIL